MDLDGNLRAFYFQFPLDGTTEIGDVTFNADDLVAGSTTEAFHIGVNVTTKDGGQPPATVVDTSLSGNTGSAQRADSGGTTTLTVDGSDDVGQTVHLVAICGPK